MSEFSSWNPQLTPSFTPAEMACKCTKCGGVANMDGGFMAQLQALRDKVGRPLTVTSGYRCASHPVELRKTHLGAHAQGLAADIAISGATERYALIKAAIEVGMTGLGVASGFIHVDAGHAYAARPAVWKY